MEQPNFQQESQKSLAETTIQPACQTDFANPLDFGRLKAPPVMDPEFAADLQEIIHNRKPRDTSATPQSLR